MSTDDLLGSLTEPQIQAVTHGEGPLLVLAGPGSGKTTVVTRRVAWLIAMGVPARQILALTFTNKAAGEMRQRIAALLAGTAARRATGDAGPTVATFHSFCARQLRVHAEAAGLPPRFCIYDADDQRNVVKEAIVQAQLSTANWTPAAVASQISAAKNRLLDARAFAGAAEGFTQRSVARAYTAYERIMRTREALDFDDLLLHMAALLRGVEAVRSQLQDRYRYLLVDEYQDTNHAQFVIAHALAEAHSNICVVGDPDQSIYGWRGADLGNILEFEEQFPRATVVPLGENFRSTGHIVAAAAGLIAHNRRRKPKRLYTSLDGGERPQVATCRDEHGEALLVAGFLKRLHEQEGLPWKEMAVLFRVNALTRVLEAALRNAGIPYVIARGTAFYERREIKEAMAYLRLVANPADEVSLRRTVNMPPRGIGDTTLRKVEASAAGRGLSLWEALRRAGEIPGLAPRAAGAIGGFVALIERFGGLAAETRAGDTAAGEAPEARLADFVAGVIRESGLERYYGAETEEERQRRENLDELINAAAQHVPPEPHPEGAALRDALQSFLETAALVSDADMIDPQRGSVTLMTLHAAKGLEFTAVAVVGLEQGVLPHSRAAENEAELEEERRLCYVGMTRARRRLLLSHAVMRTHRGICEPAAPSIFLEELPRDAVVLIDRAGSDEWIDAPRRDGRRGRGAADHFEVGCLVHHPRFGCGVVAAIMRRASGSSARVVFAGAGTRTLILEHAHLRRIDGAAVSPEGM
jgi:DNA helicase-2/ATP-dependent DNA helicase PcrA